MLKNLQMVLDMLEGSEDPVEERIFLKGNNVPD
jgi:hypothetical protein